MRALFAKPPVVDWSAFEPSRPVVVKTAVEIARDRAVETAIRAICGKPGGGKSMLAMKKLLEELTQGHRQIVTNLALELTRLQEYLDSLGANVHVVDRVRILQKEEITEFYRVRGGDIVLDLPAGYVSQTPLVRMNCPENKDTRWMDWRPAQENELTAGGTFFIIDECHNYLHPNAFGQKLTPEHPLMQWATQHRKVKDTCYLVTQSIENVHVQVRRLCQDFTYVRNERKERFKGFRKGNGFRTTTYLQPPTSESVAAVDTGSFDLDVAGVASCYCSAGGVGIAGLGTGDGGAKVKGLNLKWLYVFAFVAVVAAGVALKFGADAAVAGVVGPIKAPPGRKADPEAKKEPVAAIAADSKAVPDQGLVYTALISQGPEIVVYVEKRWVPVEHWDRGAAVLGDGRVARPKDESLVYHKPRPRLAGPGAGVSPPRTAAPSLVKGGDNISRIGR